MATADKKLALDLAINLQKGDMSIEDLNKQLEEAKKLLEDVGEESSDEFKALSQVVTDTEKSIEDMNGELSKTKKGFEETADAQKKAGQSSNIFSKGLKAVGVGLKALGIGIVVGAIKLFYDAISKNQKIMDALNTALGTIGILFEKLFGVIFNTFEAVSKASKGFSGLTAVMKGLMTIGLTPLKLLFSSIVLTIKQAQLAWEKSFFGGKDPEKIKKLTEDVADTQKEIKETGEEAIKAGKSVVDNMGKAVSEVGQVVGGVVEGVQEITIKGAFEIAKANTELKNSAAIAAAQQGLLIEKYDRQAEKLRQTRDEERNSIAERKKANDELGEVLDEQEKAMIAQADLQVAAAKAEFNKNKNTETQTALIAAQGNRLGVLAQIEGFRSEQLANDLALDREKIELTNTKLESEANLSIERKRINAEQIEDDLTRLQRQQEIDAEEEILQTERLQRVIDEAREGTQAKVDAIIALNEFEVEISQKKLEREKEIGEKEIENAQTVADAKKSIQDAQFANAEAGIGLLKTLAGDNKKIQAAALIAENAVGIAKTIIATQTANAAALATPQAVLTSGAAAAPVIAANNIAAGISIAASVAATAQGLSALKAGGSPTTGGELPQGGGAQAPQFNVVGDSGVNQLATLQQQPTQAFVVSGEVTTAQALDRNRVQNATL